MERGKVKWYDQEKNYGFIEAENGDEFFVHKTDVVEGSLDKGQLVEFEIGEGKKGPVARNVVLLIEEQ